jgi:hypothetical protein
LRLLGVNGGSIRFQDPAPTTATYELRFHRTFIWTGAIAGVLATIGWVGALDGRIQVLGPAGLFAVAWGILFGTSYLLGVSDFPAFLEEALGTPPSGGQSHLRSPAGSSPA